MKKSIIFVISRMSVGGAQKSLLAALGVLDYDKYDVTLYVRENKIALIGEVPENVRVFVNEDPHDYEHSSLARLRELGRMALKAAGRRERALSSEEKEKEAVYLSQVRYELDNSTVLGREYDVAISYSDGPTCRFTAENVRAKKKIIFYLRSTGAETPLHRKYLPLYDIIVTASVGARDHLARQLPGCEEKLRVIPDWIDAEEIKKKASVDFNARTDAPLTLCTCGRMSFEKGFDIAVEAARILKSDGVVFRWFFVGDGPQRAAVEKAAAENGVDEEIVFTGLLDNPFPYIKNCDLYIHTSREECLGNVIAEAMILSKAVVSTDTVGAREQITDAVNGFLVETDASAVARKIEELIGDAERVSRVLEELRIPSSLSDRERYRSQWSELLVQVE